MTDCLIIRDITRLNREPVDALQSTGQSLDPRDEHSCEIFSRCVAAAEATLKSTYKLAALLAKRADTPEQERDIWSAMRDYCEMLINTLSHLKGTYPQCGTPELLDLALDYRAAADERHALTQEAIQCLTSPMPRGLFPKTT